MTDSTTSTPGAQTVDPQRVRELIAPYPKDPTSLIMAMQDIQGEYNYLPRAALDVLAEELGVTPARIFRVATFYASFSLTPRGRHIVRVCMGTACHVGGAQKLLDELYRELRLDPDGAGTTDDQRFTVEPVRCLGCCALAPVVMVDDDTYGGVSVSQLPTILGRYE